MEKRARGPRGALSALTRDQALAEERLLLLAHAEGDPDLHDDLENLWANLEASATSRWGESSGEVLRAYARAIQKGYLTDSIASREPLANLPDQLDPLFRGAIAELDLIVVTGTRQIGLQAITELPQCPGGLSMVRQWMAKRWHLSLQQAASAMDSHVSPEDLKPVMLVKIWVPGPPEPVPVPGSTLMWDPGKEQVGELRVRLLQEGGLSRAGIQATIAQLLLDVGLIARDVSTLGRAPGEPPRPKERVRNRYRNAWMTWRWLRGDSHVTIAKKWNELHPGTLGRLDESSAEFAERPDVLAHHDPKELAKDHELYATEQRDLIRAAIKRYAKNAAVDLDLRATQAKFERVVSAPPHTAGS